MNTALADPDENGSLPGPVEEVLVELRTRFPDRLALCPDEVASLIQSSRSHVYDLVSAGQLPAIKVGRLTRIPMVWLAKWVADAAIVERTTLRTPGLAKRTPRAWSRPQS